MKFLKIVLMLGCLASIVSAAPLCVGNVNPALDVHTAQDLVNMDGAGCQFGDKIFFNFSYSYTLTDSNGGNTFTSPNVPASAVNVQFSNAGGQPTQPVLSFLSSWFVTNGDQGDVRIHYDVLAPPSSKMFSSTLAADADVMNQDANNFPSLVSIVESVAADAQPVQILAVNIEAPNVQPGFQNLTGFDQTFYSPALILDITKDVFLDSIAPFCDPSGCVSGNDVNLRRIDQGIIEQSSVPEPVTLILMGAGLAGLGLIKVRKKTKAEL